MTAPTTLAAGRTLVGPDLFERLTTRVAEDHDDMDINMAERVIDQTLVFLQACANNPQAQLAPSEPVDIGWHTFLLFSRDYSEFCQAVAGEFIHHAPSVDQGDLTPHQRSERIAALEATELAVDRQLWNGAVGKCGKTCHRCSGIPPA